jgi:hypothetical protein
MIEEDAKTDKEMFVEEFELADADCGAITHMVVFIRLPSGALEMIINTNDILEKFDYYKQSYDDNLRLYNNPNVKIEKWCFAGR